MIKIINNKAYFISDVIDAHKNNVAEEFSEHYIRTTTELPIKKISKSYEVILKRSSK